MTIILRKWCLEDADFIARTLSDINITNHLREGIPFPYTKEYALEYIEYILSDANDEAIAFIIEVDHKPVGNISVEKCNNSFTSVELGYYIDYKYWNCGYASKAIKLMLDYLFSNTDVRTVYAESFASNIASCRVLEKNGFTFDCMSKIMKDDRYLDTKLYYLRKR